MSPIRHTPLRILPLAADHIPELMIMEQEAYPDPWTHGMFRQEIENGAAYFYVAMLRNRIIGYGGFWLLLDEAHVTKVTVSRLYRRHGIGARLMRYLLRRAKTLGASSMRLEVRENNEPARHLYEQLGFEHAGIRRGYYTKTGESAIVMMKRI